MMRQLTKEELHAEKPSRHEFRGLPRHELYVVLDNLRCLHNIGAILRLSDALRVQKVYLCGETIDLRRKKLRNGSRGAERWVEIEQRSDACEVVAELKERGVYTVAAEIATSSVDYRNMNLRMPLCLIFGREDDGVSEQLLKFSDAVVHLPIFGMANSLNVSTVAAVLMYETIWRHYGDARML